jgi:hypothetical protein
MINMIDTILKELVENIEFVGLFRDKFTAIGPEVVTYSLNPNCICKIEVKKFLEKHRDEVSEFYQQYVLRSPDTKNETAIAADQRGTHTTTATKEGPRSLIGDVIEIGPDPTAYSEMIKHINTEGWKYNGITMMETEKTEPSTGVTEIIWLAFFY